MKKRKNVISNSNCLLIVLVFGATYAYFQASVGLGQNANINVESGAVDSLMFEVGSDISVEVGQHNFAEGMDNQSGSTYARAILKSTTDTPYTYNVYIDMKKNGFNYTTIDNKPEIMLKITDPNGNEVTSGIEGLTYTSVVDGLGNTINGFDLTPLNSSNVLKIATNYEIKTTSTITQQWNIEVIVINLDSDQSANAGSSFSAKLVVRREEHAGAKMLKQVSDSTNTEIWGHKDKITKIVFEDTAVVHEDAEYTYDISSLQDKSVMAYMINNGDDTYTTYINSDGKITANRDSSFLFYKFTKLTTIEGLENLDTSRVTNMRSMFDGDSSLMTIDLSSFDTSQVEYAAHMFYGCNNLNALDVSNFDTSQVIDMGYMFYNCNSLTALNVSNFNTSKVTNMSAMFAYCSLSILDLSNFDTSQVTNMSSMFYGCNSLTTIDLRNADFTRATEHSNMLTYIPSSISIIVKDQYQKNLLKQDLDQGKEQ